MWVSVFILLELCWTSQVCRLLFSIEFEMFTIIICFFSVSVFLCLSLVLLVLLLHVWLECIMVFSLLWALFSVFIFSLLFVLWSLGWRLSVGPSSSLLHLSDVSSDLPFLSSGELFISVNVVFSYKISTWFFLIISIYWYSVFDESLGIYSFYSLYIYNIFI